MDPRTAERSRVIVSVEGITHCSVGNVDVRSTWTRNSSGAELFAVGTLRAPATNDLTTVNGPFR